jgi:hypothetical protein
VKKQITFTILFLIIILPQAQGLLSTSQTINNSGLIVHQQSNTNLFSQVGVEYLSTYGTYQDSDTVLRRDFALFKQSGINLVVFGINWYRVEGPTRGDYNGTYPDGTPYGNQVLDGVKRFVSISSEYNIKVVISFYTLWGDDGIWCTPKYVNDPVTNKSDQQAIVRSDEMRQAFVDMFTYTVNYLAGTPNVIAWDILGEPWYYPSTLPAPYSNINQKENFIQLIQTLSSTVKRLDGRPVSIPFVSSHEYTDITGQPSIINLYEQDFGWDQRILDALDFFCFSTLMPSDPQLHEQWFSITQHNVESAVSYGKKVWIEGIGSSSEDDNKQKSDYYKQINFLQTIPVDSYTVWCWWIDPNNAGKEWNLVKDSYGNPRIAFEGLKLNPTGSVS